ncbi:helix-turn-helix domain-containing protein [Sulfolobus acidocaldarius]|uniref:Conserved conjugative plasmid protein n=4 Tax=Sulfolobus acidocaldarius TaxID=2285 RepID=Q4JBE0_SULAC|nr:helix-turn-helix domain-containing protein [Sulfolobus acidocaldarius]AAY79889.1 conserved conjugative plasmid protein [Sulfolobus acidocaldarius DSM 639]AGE70453.1 conjugative plasmid protein [Sulfolobus acidocaldarius N8]AGE72727.1 conjugative plasmid protein [Sulfolobus acidocaldarius Ron12/I]ALU29166.1 conjugal transfer protein [Sulfolobus acidocaldarius]ALU31891.1 conjugal transfer protein [Sulfolobus acidocaldarius]
MELSEVEQRILKALLKKDKMTARELVDASHSSTSVLNPSLEHLIKLGLVNEEREHSFPRRRFVILTESGKEVAQLLVEIERIVEMKKASKSLSSS